MSSLISLRNVEYCYPHLPPTPLKPVLSNISLSLQQGETIGLVGSNGSGKSTLLKIIATLLKPTQGSYQFGNSSVYEQLQDFRNKVNYSAGGSLGFYPRLSAIENLMFFSGIKGKLLKTPEIEKILNRVGLKNEAFHEKYFKYSLGMRQRMHIAKLLLEPSHIILADEPTNGLDQDGIQNVISLLNVDLKKKTKIIISHDFNFLAKVSDHLLEIKQGVITQEVSQNASLLPLPYQTPMA